MNNEDIEVLDFDDRSSDNIEVVDLDNKVSDSIDALLNDALKGEETNNNNEVFEEVNSKKLDVYVPSLKNFNIKSAKVHKIVKKVMIYTIIFILFTFEFFLNKADKVLTDIRVYASDNDPIMISKNDKYGFVDYTGEVLVNPKYSYAEDYINGYAIVKDASNLPLVIDKGGKEVIKTGDYFNMVRAGNNIIVSKATDKGLKYGILRSDLKQILDFKYDLINYKDGIYTFTNGNYVGILNSKYKEVYKFKLNDFDSKAIDINPSTITDSNKVMYAVVTINRSSVILNIQNGKVVTTQTLNTIIPEDNNVFYEDKGNGIKEYYYVYNDKLMIDSIDYNYLEMPSLEAGVLKAFKKDYSYEVILGKTGEAYQDLAISDTYFGDDVFIYKTYDMNQAKSVYKLISNGKEVASLDNIKGIKRGFKNGYAIIINNDNKYAYIDKSGKLLNEDAYTSATSFDKYGDAIIKKGNKYCLLNNKRGLILDCKYNNIKSASDKYKINNMSENQTIYYAAKEGSMYKLYNMDGKEVIDDSYTNVAFDDEYGFVKVSNSLYDKIISSSTLESISINSFSTKYKSGNNYIILGNKYYNKKGKVIYVMPKNK